jgi:hypothetical protein
MSNTFLLPVVALYKAPHFTGYDSNNVISINADLVQAFTPRPLAETVFGAGAKPDSISAYL